MATKLPVSQRIILLAVALSAICLPAGTSRQARAAEGADDSGKPAGLSGAVKATAVTCAAGLKSIGQLTSRIKRTASELVGECTRQNLVVVSEPDVIGPVVIPAMPAPDGMIAAGDYLPPRKHWLELYAADFARTIGVLDTEIQSTVLPDGASADCAAKWSEMKSVSADINTQYQGLIPLIQAQTPDRLALGRVALAIHDDAEKIEKVRKELFHMTKNLR